jgi:hypothetical protein
MNRACCVSDPASISKIRISSGGCFNEKNQRRKSRDTVPLIMRLYKDKAGQIFKLEMLKISKSANF